MLEVFLSKLFLLLVHLDTGAVTLLVASLEIKGAVVPLFFKLVEHEADFEPVIFSLPALSLVFTALVLLLLLLADFLMYRSPFELMTLGGGVAGEFGVAACALAPLES